jgi:hypothetical protein
LQLAPKRRRCEIGIWKVWQIGSMVMG